MRKDFPEYVQGQGFFSDTGIQALISSTEGQVQEISPERLRSYDPAPLKVREVKIDGQRYVFA